MPDDDAPDQQPDEPAASDIPEVYELETLEQLRAIADELRSRIAEALTHRPMTATQVAGMLGEKAAKVHYHVRELERVGLVRLVATHEKSGILEKYYRAVARTFTASKSLLVNVPSDEVLATLRSHLEYMSRAFLQATEFTIRNEQWENPKVWGFNTTQIWITYDEMKALARRIQDEFDKYATPRGIEGEEERTIVMMGYDPRVVEENKTEPPSSPPSTPPELPPPPKKGASRPRKHHMVAAGVYLLQRSDLEDAIAQNRQLDISAIGVCTFADDITPELVEQAIGSFHHRGILTASSAVREALKRKER
ncbi:MAG TPA: helix-turn-helix domain-containing protein [Ktedonobacterales bacterium]|nr:helix-turn-helix domain-containing protein [Ktedonobacterales bacterium]